MSDEVAEREKCPRCGDKEKDPHCPKRDVPCGWLYCHICKAIFTGKSWGIRA